MQLSGIYAPHTTVLIVSVSMQRAKSIERCLANPAKPGKLRPSVTSVVIEDPCLVELLRKGVCGFFERL